MIKAPILGLLHRLPMGFEWAFLAACFGTPHIKAENRKHRSPIHKRSFMLDMLAEFICCPSYEGKAAEEVRRRDVRTCPLLVLESNSWNSESRSCFGAPTSAAEVRTREPKISWPFLSFSGFAEARDGKGKEFRIIPPEIRVGTRMRSKVSSAMRGPPGSFLETSTGGLRLCNKALAKLNIPS